MKLYDGRGPNPKIVRMFLAEKGIDLPIEKLDIIKGENRQAAHLSRNPSGQVPTLELDNGDCISESTVICEYLEELYPQPSLLGEGAQRRAEVRMWTRKIDLAICAPMSDGFRFSEGLNFFKSRITCYPDAAVSLKKMAQDGLQWLDRQLAGKSYIVGECFTLADILLYSMVDYFHQSGQPLNHEYANVVAWFERVQKRPSARS